MLAGEAEMQQPCCRFPLGFASLLLERVFRVHACGKAGARKPRRCERSSDLCKARDLKG